MQRLSGGISAIQCICNFQQASYATVKQTAEYGKKGGAECMDGGDNCRVETVRLLLVFGEMALTVMVLVVTRPQATNTQVGQVEKK